MIRGTISLCVGDTGLTELREPNVLDVPWWSVVKPGGTPHRSVKCVGCLTGTAEGPLLCFHHMTEIRTEGADQDLRGGGLKVNPTRQATQTQKVWTGSGGWCMSFTG